MYYFLRELFIKLKLKILSVKNVKVIFTFFISKVLKIFDTSDNVGKFLKSGRSWFKKRKTKAAVPVKDKFRLSSLSIVDKETVSSRIERTNKLNQPDEKELYPRLRNYDINYLKSGENDKSRFPVLIKNIQKSTNVLTKVSAKSISRYFRFMFFTVVILMSLGCIIFIPVIRRVTKHEPQINGNQLRALILKESEAFLNSPAATPPQLGNLNSQNNLWDRHSQNMISYNILKQSNSYNFTWVIEFKYAFFSSNPISAVVQSAYILHSTVNAKLVVINNALAVQLSLYKEWTTDFHYFFIPTLSLAKFIKGTNYFRYRYAGQWNPTQHKNVYAGTDYYWTNYTAAFQLNVATLNLSSYNVVQNLVNFNVSRVTDTTSHSANFDFQNYSVSYPGGTSPAIIIISAFKGPQEYPITYQFEFRVHYVNFVLVKINKPQVELKHRSQLNSNHPHNSYITTKNNYNKAEHPTNVKDIIWKDPTPKDYDFILPDVTTSFADLLKPDIYTSIKTITFFQRLRINNSTDDGAKPLEQIPQYNSFWPIYVNKFELRFQDFEHKITYLCVGQRWVNHDKKD